MKPYSDLRVLVVDDELPAREHLSTLLSRMSGISVVGTADNGVDAVAAIRRLNPDLVFLDIQMPGMTGLEVVQEMGAEQMPVTIFVTAYDRHALKAFELAAVDYLLKPFDDERFEQAVARVRKLHELKQSGQLAQRIRTAFESMGMDTPAVTAAPQGQYLARIAVESRGQIRVVPVDHIDYITASGVYADLHVGDKTHVVRERMQSLEERLNPAQFFRVHRSVIVQLDRIDVLLRQAGGDYTLKLKSGAQVPVSRNRIEQLEHWMGVPSPDS
ncbi:MAG: LytTR family DNA-binding domain-containing protein [Steroidobacteraceae bacterium]